jgi:PTS system glucitol/sorbitol-specific IIC component
MLLMVGMVSVFLAGLVSAQQAEATPEEQPATEVTETVAPPSADESTVPEEEGWLAELAEDFIGLFQRGGEVFASLVVGIVPLLIVLLTGVNALIALIGTERVEKVGEWAARDGIIYYPIRYMIFPFLAVFFLTNPMAYTLGRFLPEKYKPAFYDSAVSYVHPPLGLFPHINPGEIFVWSGIAFGITQLGLGLGDLAIRYALVGLVVILIRGTLTQWITAIMWRRQETGEQAS